MTVEDLFLRVSPSEFREWQKFDELEPIGQSQMFADQRNAMLSWIISNLLKKSGKMEDFLLLKQPEPAGQTPEQVIAEMRKWAAKQNAAGESDGSPDS